MTEIVITKELQLTVKSNDHIDTVYFDSKGRHYFNVHKLPVDKDKKEQDLFGSGLFSHNQVIPGKTNIDKLTEIISKGDPETRIVNKMSREEVLNAQAKIDEETTASKILNSTPEEKAAILSALGITPEILLLLGKLKEEKPEEAKKAAVKLP